MALQSKKQNWEYFRWQKPVAIRKAEIRQRIFLSASSADNKVRSGISG
jgi:hypothetical protein